MSRCETWDRFKSDTVATGIQQTKNFKAGRLVQHLPFWKTLTSDSVILSIIGGATIDFETEVIQTEIPEPYQFPNAKMKRIDKEIQKLESKSVIEKTGKQPGQFISNIFTREKSDETLRIILDLTELNESVVYQHFKMDSLNTAINLMSKNCYMASIDWKDAYYSFSIATSYRKFLCFEWRGQLYHFTCFPNGLSSAPRLFTKITKVLFSELRKAGHINTSYIDDCLLIANSIENCRENVKDTVQISERAGFVVHPVKSVLEPTQQLVYLGFWLNSTEMSVKLTDKKAEKIKNACQRLLHKTRLTIRELAQVIGLMVASFPGVQFGQLFYRRLDNYKSLCIKEKRGNYAAAISLTEECKIDLTWWFNNITHQKRFISINKPTIHLESDACKTGWGGCKKGGREESTGGHWDDDESQMHINYLEILAAWFTILSYCKSNKGCHIKICSDNTTTVTYLNNLGGKKFKCNELARKIGLWCYENENWITASYLPGELNVVADRESRSVHDNTEWSLHPILFHKICQRWGTPEIDLFANRLNNKVPKYLSWKPDPGALAIDALNEVWSDWFFYAFPPFNLIGRIL